MDENNDNTNEGFQILNEVFGNTKIDNDEIQLKKN
jgi:hypothetical protein